MCSSDLASPPILVAPMEKEPLLLYIAATNQVVIAVLAAERDASPKKSSKGKRPGDPFPGQSSKKEHTPRRRSRGLLRQHPGAPRTWNPLKGRRPARCSTLSTSSARCYATPGSDIP